MAKGANYFNRQWLYLTGVRGIGRVVGSNLDLRSVSVTAFSRRVEYTSPYFCCQSLAKSIVNKQIFKLFDI